MFNKEQTGTAIEINCIKCGFPMKNNIIYVHGQPVCEFCLKQYSHVKDADIWDDFCDRLIRGNW